MKPHQISPPHRYPSGQIIEAHTQPRKETAEQIMAVVRWQREKLGATAENYTAQEWVSPLGRMRAWAVVSGDACEGLSRPQHMALALYIKDRWRARWAQGFPQESPRSISMEMVAEGIALTEDPDDETVFKLRAAHNSAKSALLEFLERGNAWVRLLDGLALDQGDDLFWRAALGEVRSAANVLMRHYKIQHGD